MEQIDTSKRKPRRTQGTPSFYYRNRFAYAVIGTGLAIFYLWNLTPMQKKINEKSRTAFKRTEEEIDRQGLFEFPAARTSNFIRETIKEKEKLMSER